MERKSGIIVLIVLLLISSTTRATERQKIYEAYITNNMAQWEQVLVDMENQKPLTNERTLELLNYQYGYIAWCIGNDLEDKAEAWLEATDANLEFLEKNAAYLQLVHAYKAAFYGYRIGLSPYKAPFYGPKSMEHAKLSIKDNASNWFGIVQNANILFYMPSIFGGSKSDAIKQYKQALQIVEKDSALIVGDWNYINLLVTIANAYKEVENQQMANSYYQRILSIEPQFAWAKDELQIKIIKE